MGTREEFKGLWEDAVREAEGGVGLGIECLVVVGGGGGEWNR